VLVAGTPKFSANGDYPHGLPTHEVKGMELRLKRDYQKTMGEFFRGMFADGELDREQYQKIVHEIVLGGRTPEPEVARRSLQALASADLRAVLPRIDLPVLLMHGGADVICLPAASRYMMKQMPNARLEVFEGLGHAPFLSRPDGFNKLLKEFADGIYGRD
jgi:non-heme chloroperoxidase